MSLSRAEEYGGDYRPTRRMSRVHRDSMANFSESFSHDENLRGSSGNFQEGGIVLGPLQKKNTYQMTYSKFGDLLLDFKISRTVIEMSVSF